MNKTIHNDYNLISSSNPKALKLGVSTSGRIHIGTLVTILTPMIYLTENSEANLEITIHDAYSTPRKNKSFLPQYHQQATLDGNITIAKFTHQEIACFIGAMCEFQGINEKQVSIKYMSETLKDPNFRSTLSEMLKDDITRKEMKRLIMQQGWNNNNVPIHPVCPDCYHTSSAFSKYDPESNTLTTTCHNQFCETDKYSIDISNPKHEFVMYYLLNLLRDVISTEGNKVSDMHFCGGDKLDKNGVKYDGQRITIAERGRKIMGLASQEVPDIFIGTRVDYNGRKLSKSNNTRFTYSRLKNTMGDSWQETILRYCIGSWGRDKGELKECEFMKKMIMQKQYNHHN